MNEFQRDNPFDVDALGLPPAFAAIKAALPFLEPRSRSLLGLAVKISEIGQLSENLRFELSAVNRAWSGVDDVHERRKRMLAAVTPYLQGEGREMAEALNGLLETLSALESGKTGAGFGAGTGAGL